MNHRLILIVVVPLAVTVLGGCSREPGSGEDATMMQAGIEALYTRHDPAAAAREFRKVLERNPSHYGATFQLAAALDAAGRPDEARPVWEKILAMAERQGDRETAEAARTHLGRPGGASEATIMQAGLDALYKRHDPAEAAAQFQKVLQQNPTHYGATFQLAMALDQAGKADEARPVWEKVLAMAEAVHDQQTADTARKQLQKRP